jgi:hypothetical protein
VIALEVATVILVFAASLAIAVGVAFGVGAAFGLLFAAIDLALLKLAERVARGQVAGGPAHEPRLRRGPSTGSG